MPFKTGIPCLENPHYDIMHEQDVCMFHYNFHQQWCVVLFFKRLDKNWCENGKNAAELQGKVGYQGLRNSLANYQPEN